MEINGLVVAEATYSTHPHTQPNPKFPNQSMKACFATKENVVQTQSKDTSASIPYAIPFHTKKKRRKKRETYRRVPQSQRQMVIWYYGRLTSSNWTNATSSQYQTTDPTPGDYQVALFVAHVELGWWMCSSPNSCILLSSTVFGSTNQLNWGFWKSLLVVVELGLLWIQASGQTSQPPSPSQLRCIIPSQSNTASIRVSMRICSVLETILY